MITFCHSYLYGGFFPRKYRDSLLNLLLLSPSGAKTLLEKVFGKNDASFILQSIEEDDFDAIDKRSTVIRIRVLLRAFFRNPLQTLVGAIFSYYQQFENSLRINQ
jgi:hypothetical protein